MVLALETSTNVCSVAFYDGADVYERRFIGRGSHSENLFLFIEELQQEQAFNIPDLDAVLVSEGPGSYTGLRIAASAVKGLLFETEVQLYGVHTLAAFAFRAVQESEPTGAIHVIIDARRVHLYHQKFTFGNGILDSEKEVETIPIKEFKSLLQPGDSVIGTGLNRINDEALEDVQCFGPGMITAKSLIELYNNKQSDFYHKVDAEAFDPKYYTSNQVS